MNPIRYRYPLSSRRDWLVGATLVWACAPLHAAPDAQAILAASDAIRNPSRPFSVTVTLTEFQGGSEINSSTLQSYSRILARGGQFASILRYVKPARDSGKLMLKVGSDLWFFDPATKASVRISPQQRLAGQASNGDVVTVNFARDYTATVAATEEITDGERRKRKSLKLGLTAASDEAVYASAELWVDAESHQPLKARFYADSGRALKTAYYRRYQSQLGAERPTEMVIIDGLDPQAVTVLRMSEYVAREIPVNWYSRDFLPRFQPE